MAAVCHGSATALDSHTGITNNPALPRKRAEYWREQNKTCLQVYYQNKTLSKHIWTVLTLEIQYAVSIMNCSILIFIHELEGSGFVFWSLKLWQIFYPMSPFFDSPSLFVCKNSLTYFSCSFQSSYFYLLSPSPHYPSTSSCMPTCTDGLLASERWDLKDS